jgi:hypothetical protein
MVSLARFERINSLSGIAEPTACERREERQSEKRRARG